MQLATADAVARLYRLGSLAQSARREPFARAVAAYVASLRVPSPRKEYRVRYRATPVSGLSDWDAIPKAERPVLQPLDRAYGGSMDFLETDVTTGSRSGAGAGSAAAGKDEAEKLGASLGVLCDEFGIHFRFEYDDPRAREIEARLLGGGSYEIYLAPGANLAHTCLLIDVQTGRLSFANLTYDGPEFTCLKTDRPDLYRREHRFSGDRVVSYVFLSWNAYGYAIPSNGSVWEFENVLWARKGNFAWNGTESIHGRSTWGRLVFDLPASAHGDPASSNFRGACGVQGGEGDPIRTRRDSRLLAGPGAGRPRILPSASQAAGGEARRIRAAGETRDVRRRRRSCRGRRAARLGQHPLHGRCLAPPVAAPAAFELRPVHLRLTGRFLLV